MDAAARLSLMLDFDVKSFDAFCHCLEYSSLLLQRSDHSRHGASEAPQYRALCDWILEVCKKLVEPAILKQQSSTASNLKSATTETGVDRPPPLEDDEELASGARGRFVFFRQKVARARIWTDHDRKLWRRLKSIAMSYMMKVSPICDARFEALCKEAGAEELLQFSGPISDCLDGADSTMPRVLSVGRFVN